MVPFAETRALFSLSGFVEPRLMKSARLYQVTRPKQTVELPWTWRLI